MGRLRAWGVPGFRRGGRWRATAAVAGYAAILLLFLLALFSPVAALVFLAAALALVTLATDGWGLRRRLLGDQDSAGVRAIGTAVLLLLGGGAWVVGMSAAPPRRPASAEAVVGQVTPTPRPPTVVEAGRTAAAQVTGGAAPLVEAARAEAVELLGQAVAQREAGQLGLALELGRQALGKAPDSAEARSFVATVQPQATAAQRDALAQATSAQRAAVAEATQAARTAASEAAAATARALPTRAPTPRVQTAGSAPCLSGQIKANRESDIYHTPAQRDYERTQANVACFDTVEQARAAGFRPAER